MTVYGQPTQETDKVWIYRQDALRKLAQADSMKVYKEISMNLKRDVDTLQARIDVLSQSINTLKSRSANDMAIIEAQETQKRLLQEEKKILLDQIGVLNKSIRKLKRKVFWTAMAGVTVAGGTFWLGSNIK